MMKLKKLFLIICTICFAVALACGVAACGDNNDNVIRVTSVGLNKYELTLAVGGEETLTAIINPSNATEQTVAWSSSAPDIATVDDSGKVAAKAVGETTVTATAGGKQASCKVTVTESTAVGVSSITLNHTDLVMTVGETNTNLVPTVLPANSATVSWSSSDTDCVTVNDKGHVTAVAIGTATITATAGGKSATCKVTVVAEKVVEGVELSDEELELEVNGTKTITATVLPKGLNAVVTWTSSKTDVASVDNGRVTAHTVGETVITATAGEKSATCKVTVKAKTPATVAVESVSLDNTSLSMNIGDEEKLTPTISPSNATNKNVTWKSSDENIATVDGNGKVTAVKVGEATITVTTVDGGKTATCDVRVKQPVVNNTIVTYAHAGEESAAFEWKDNDASKAKVEYKLSSASSYTKIDSQLIRQMKDNETARADVLGLKGGAKYDFKITSSDNTVVEVKEVNIASLDRSGYAHYNYTSGVGAYNDDGTLKSNAKVIYLTEANKNDIDGKGTSIAEYLNDGSKVSTPVVIRVVGTVGSATWKELKYRALVGENDYLEATEVKGLNNKQLPTGSNELTQAYLIKEGYNELNLYPEKLGGVQCDPIDGLNSKASFSVAKDGKPDRYDSCWNDCQVKGFSNLTVEGVGEDAEIFQWGFTFNGCNSIEVRNIRFWDYTEDACSFEGSENATKLSGFKHSNFWVHHNIFDIGMNYWDVCEEQDKNDGDGATDFKKLSYVTVAYNRYNGTHKTGLVGGDDKHYQACFTFHHNYYNGCDQRMPLGRQANMHLYNNYYSSSGMYSVSLRAGAYAYIENCVFTSNPTRDTKPIVLEKDSAGMPSVKVVDCDMQGSIQNKTSGNSADIIYNGSRSGAKNVGGANLYGPNFETTADFATYYKVTSKLDKSAVKTTIPQVAGTLKNDNNIAIDGSSQGGGGTGGGDTPTVSPDADKVTASIDSAVAAGTLAVNGNAHDIARTKIANNVYVEATGGKVSSIPATFDNLSFVYRFVLNKPSNSNTRYIEITTGSAATINVYLGNTSGKDGDREIGLYTDKLGNSLVAGTTVTALSKTDTAIMISFTVTAGGTYNLLSITNELSIYAIDIAAGSGGGSTDTYSNVSVKIEDIVKTDTNPNGILDLSENNFAYDKTIATGIKLKMTGKVTEHANKKVGDITFNYRVVLKGTGNYFEIETQAQCTIKIYVANAGKDGDPRVIGLFTDTKAENEVVKDSLAASTSKVVEFSVSKGTFYLESLTNDLSIYAIEIIYS